jgi:LysR family transcriptional regulator, glycine cleavage system transcriptional activator
MSRRLPPLNALRAFEAAARHLSFTNAAEELHVTQAAISHQVKSLEEILGLSLFRRYNRRLALTDAGQAHLPALRESFDQIASATQRISRDNALGELRVSTLQSFAAKWLVPRLPGFQERYPDIVPMISTSYRVVDFRREEFDVAIRLGRGIYPDLHVTHLGDDWVFPVCAPRLKRGAHALREPSDLRHHLLLHDSAVSNEPQAPNWRSWLKLAKVGGIAVDRGPAYSDTALALQAAIAGLGVALGRRSLVAADIKAGHLVRPFGPVMQTRFSWWIVCGHVTADMPKVRAFREWLRSEMVNDAREGR